jgi:hypothetical protein
LGDESPDSYKPQDSITESLCEGAPLGL